MARRIAIFSRPPEKPWLSSLNLAIRLKQSFQAPAAKLSSSQVPLPEEHAW